MFSEPIHSLVGNVELTCEVHSAALMESWYIPENSLKWIWLLAKQGIWRRVILTVDFGTLCNCLAYSTLCLLCLWFHSHGGTLCA